MLLIQSRYELYILITKKKKKKMEFLDLQGNVSNQLSSNTFVVKEKELILEQITFS